MVPILKRILPIRIQPRDVIEHSIDEQITPLLRRDAQLGQQISFGGTRL